jgi:hypothetical protein
MDADLSTKDFILYNRDPVTIPVLAQFALLRLYSYQPSQQSMRWYKRTILRQFKECFRGQLSLKFPLQDLWSETPGQKLFWVSRKYPVIAKFYKCWLQDQVTMVSRGLSD